jgi:prepilin-type N-terminal cleavage/methylation domain-containing protein
MKCGSQMRRETRARSRRRAHSSGFSLLEMVIVVAISLILAGVAIPVIQSAVRYFAIRSAVSSFTSIVQSTRYQAIFHGCQYQLAFTAATNTYLVSSKAPAAGGVACTGAFAVVGTGIPVPIAGARNGVTLNADVTLVFAPSGTVQATTGTLGGIVLNENGTAPEAIQVSTYGKILVTP